MLKRLLLGFLVVAGCVIIPLVSTGMAQTTVPKGGWKVYCPTCRCEVDYPHSHNSPPPPSGGNSSYDPGAAQREQEAENQRKRDAELEQQRIDADNKRQREEKEKQADFVRKRNEAAITLRGSTGASATANGLGGSVLRGSGFDGASGSGLRGSAVDTCLRDVKTDTAQAPNLDPMVVDARVAPMGADLLSQVPELERSPAADRIRKGYQALMTRDWPVALAWWQDALQRDPNNAALMRSVDLAQWMVDSRKRAASRQSTSADPAIKAAMRGDATEVINLIGQAKKRNAIQDAGAERMTNMIDNQIKQRAAAPKAPKRLPKSASMSQMATAGDRALSEQMFEDRLQFLVMGDYEHAEQMFQRADFQRNFDAGKPFYDKQVAK